MKNLKTIMAISIGALFTTGVNAQTATFEGTTAVVPNAGNALERELTPVLRDQGRKKVLLENKKLDLEIKKVDLAAEKIQQEMLSLTNPVAQISPFQGMSGINGLVTAPMGLPIPASAPTIAPGATGVPSSLPIPATAPSLGAPAPETRSDRGPLTMPEPVRNLSGEAVDDSDDSIRVLMILGAESNLQAKVMHNNQGGYVLGKGDILPNGKKIVSVAPQFIEVSPPNSKKKSDRTKIYVSGYPIMKDGKVVENEKKRGGSDDSVLTPEQLKEIVSETVNNTNASGVGIPLAPSKMIGAGITPGQVR